MSSRTLRPFTGSTSQFQCLSPSMSSRTHAGRLNVCRRLVSVPVSKHVLSDEIRVNGSPADLFQCLSPSMSSRTIPLTQVRPFLAMVSVPVSKHVLSDSHAWRGVRNNCFSACLQACPLGLTRMARRTKQLFQCLSPSMSSRTALVSSGRLITSFSACLQACPLGPRLGAARVIVCFSACLQACPLGPG